MLRDDVLIFRYRINTTLLTQIMWALVAISLAGCAMAREPSKTPRTAIEQLLLAHAIDRGLRDLRLPIADGSSVAVEVAGFSNYLPFQSTGQQTKDLLTQPPANPVYGPKSDLLYIQDAVAGRLGELGYRVQEDQQGALYLIKVLVQAIGTEQSETFLGMPAVQSVLIPFALPELTLFRKQNQMGYMRYSLDVYDVTTRRFVLSSPWYLGTAYYHQFTVLFSLQFKRTDLPFPPEPLLIGRTVDSSSARGASATGYRPRSPCEKSLMAGTRH
ncbi:MAG: hypothetical protein ACREJU_14110 [Nitrospiraceae bacterium]